MARSYKKTPVFGITTAVSEKKDKQLAHKACRAHFRTSILSAASIEDFMFEERNEAHSNVWGHAKDGKQRVDLRVVREGRTSRVLRSPAWLKDVRETHKLLAK